MAKKKLPKKSTKTPTKPAKRPARPAARKAKARARARTKARTKAKTARKPLKAKKVIKPAARKAGNIARDLILFLLVPTIFIIFIVYILLGRLAVKAVKMVVRTPARKAAPTPARKAATPPPPVRLQRERRRLPEVEAEGFTGTGGDARLLQSAKAGHDEMQSELRQHTESSPELTAGDVDAKWQDAYAVGDEAPGGDNMTPDQDRVDDIGKALGIEYDDDEELQGGAELTARDESRWELDPDSKEEEDDE